jgi:hypothetical protein
MVSPAMRPSAKVVTLVNGTRKLPPVGGTPSQSPPLVPVRWPQVTITLSPNAVLSSSGARSGNALK